ncbi:MAG: nucleoside recognition protein [Halobacteriales archaeon]
MAEPAPLSAIADLIVRIGRIAVFIAIGVFLANVAVEFGLVERIAALSKYLTRPANLPNEVGTAILTTAASTTAGYGMLAEFRDSGMLDDRATLVAVTINTFFGFVQHILTYYAPVLIPILGLRVGLLYVGARAGISLGITLVGILAGALLLSERNVDYDAVPDGVTDPETETTTHREKVTNAGERAAGKLRDIIPRLAVIYTLVVVLTTYYDITQLTAGADPLATVVGLPVAAVPIIAVFAVDTTSGALAIAPLVPGTFTPEQAVATMLIGGIVSFAISTFKRSIPFQYGIWGPAFGSKVIAVNTTLKVVFIGAAVVIVLGL